MGNICRSPTGEGIFKKHLEDRGSDDKVFVDSAGTIGYHAGKPADARMQSAAGQKGYQLTSISRQVTRGDLNEFDLVIAMDRENYSDLQHLKRNSDSPTSATIKLLSDYLGGDWPTDVPDPYYGGDDGFHYVVEMIESACDGIHDELLGSE